MTEVTMSVPPGYHNTWDKPPPQGQVKRRKTPYLSDPLVARAVILFSQNLKAIRRRKLMPVEDLAGAVDCDVRTLWRYEAGVQIPGMWMLVRLSAALKVPVTELLEDI